MNLDLHFQKFDSNISLDGTRKLRIASAILHLEEFIASDEELSSFIDGEIFLQGSYATHTAVRPLTGKGEFDVDIVYPFDRERFQGRSAKEVVDWFTSRFEKDAFYKANLIKKPRCIRINYSGDFHLDVVPAVREANYFLIPTRDASGWKKTTPILFKEWVLRTDRQSGGEDENSEGYFVRSVRIMKRWRDTNFSPENAPSSIILTSILGHHEASLAPYSIPPLENPLFGYNPCHATYIYDMLRLTYDCIVHHPPTGVPLYHNPVDPSEDLAINWSAASQALFLKKLGECIQSIKAGIDASTETVAVEAYKKAFGDTFPASIN